MSVDLGGDEVRGQVDRSLEFKSKELSYAQ